jgi:hypothetical protein
MLWVLLVPLRRNYGTHNARQPYSYQVDFELKSEDRRFDPAPGHHL